MPHSLETTPPCQVSSPPRQSINFSSHDDDGDDVIVMLEAEFITEFLQVAVDLFSVLAYLHSLYANDYNFRYACVCVSSMCQCMYVFLRVFRSVNEKMDY